MGSSLHTFRPTARVPFAFPLAGRTTLHYSLIMLRFSLSLSLFLSPSFVLSLPPLFLRLLLFRVLNIIHFVYFLMFHILRIARHSVNSIWHSMPHFSLLTPLATLLPSPLSSLCLRLFIVRAFVY